MKTVLSRGLPAALVLGLASAWFISPLPAIAACTTDADCNDGDPCTDDACTSVGGSFTCSNTPNTGASCDDGNQCTTDACNDGLCVGTPNLSTCHFQCYEVKPAAFASPVISLEDQFAAYESVTMRFPHRLCAPADKNGEDPSAPSRPDHLEGYDLRGPVVLVRNQEVVDQFGTLFLDVIALDRLFVPTAKSLTGPPFQLSNPVTDHFDCYKVRRSSGTTAFLPRTVAVQDQLGSATITLKKPFRLCVPTNKNDEAPGAELHPVNFLCYQVKERSFPTLTAFTNNQFGPGNATLIHRRELCVPAVVGDCYDGYQDGEETGADCGGPDCQPCPLGGGCATNADCTSGYCTDGFCQPPPTCEDATQGGDETGPDCGGRFCFKCDPGAGCNDPSDCTSGVCSGNVCQSPSCSDGVLNGDESDKDCGGSCSPCSAGRSCNADSDCQSNNCGEDDHCGSAPTTTSTTTAGTTTTSTTTTLLACTCDACKALQTDKDGGNDRKLPNPIGCTTAGQADCNGWTPAGTLKDEDDLSGAGANRANHFVREFTTACGKFLCSYLPRWNDPQDNTKCTGKKMPYPCCTGAGKGSCKKMLHGLLCFSQSGCNTCAYDEQPASDDPTKDDRLFKNLPLQEDDKATNSVPCGGCHRPGPILPKAQLWKDAKGDLQFYNTKCTANGGPKWLCMEDEEDFPAPDPTDIVPNTVTTGVQDACGAGHCHAQGFVRRDFNLNYCKIVRTAFLKGGSMEGRGVKYTNKWNKCDCTEWMRKMKCSPKNFCTDGDIAVQCKCKGETCSAPADCCSNTCTSGKCQ